MSIWKVGFLIIIIIHGLIHLLGFVKAFNLAELSQFTNSISKPVGGLWMITCLLFMVAAINFGLKKEWTTIVFIALFLSQIAIMLSWSDAKFGTLANILIFVVAVINIQGIIFKKSFFSDANAIVARSEKTSPEMLSRLDISHLPNPVQNYLTYTNAIGKPKLNNMEVRMSGQMRGKAKDWFNFESIQYNTFDKHERLFFMEADISTLPTKGYHSFKDSKAKMDIRLLSVFPVVSESGDLLKKAETVTIFNDLCIMAPAALIDKNIQWETVNDDEVVAHFTNEGITITAHLIFDKEGALVNFYSDDRIDINDNKSYRFSTPISGYQNQNGYRIPTLGKAIWHYPDEAFVYGEFNILSITYNVKGVQK